MYTLNHPCTLVTSSQALLDQSSRNFCQTYIEVAVLMQQSTLRSFHPLWNTSAQNEDGVCQFSPTRATNRLL